MPAVTAVERGRQVRQALGDAAAELIAERGWSAVSTRLLAERAGVTSGVVHYHFASLQALLIEAAIGRMRELLDGLLAVVEQASTPEQAVDRLAGSLDEFTGRDPASLLFTETYLAATRDDQLRTEMAAVVADFRGRLAVWFAAHGVARAEPTAVVLVAALDGVLMHRSLEAKLTGATVTPVLRRLVGERNR